jgi:hypothetical protein
MSERIKQHKEKLAAARQHLNEVFDKVGAGWDTQVYSDGAQWTVQQLAIHLMVTDKGHNNMLMAIARGENTVPEDFDLERFNRRSVEKQRDAGVTVEQIRSNLKATRDELNAWLDTLDEKLLENKGRHGTMRILTISEILDVVAGHERQHADDIAKAIGITV